MTLERTVGLILEKVALNSKLCNFEQMTQLSEVPCFHLSITMLTLKVNYGMRSDRAYKLYSRDRQIQNLRCLNFIQLREIYLRKRIQFL